MLNKLPDIVRAAAEPLAEANITLVGDSVNPIAKGAGSGLASTLELIRGTTGLDVVSLLNGASADHAPAESGSEVTPS